MSLRLLLVISGSVAAYKSLDLIRRARERGHTVRTVLTAGGAQFITPLAVASLSGEACYTDLFSLKDETEMGHIRLSREADAILVAPASANLLAKMAAGIADDLATAVLLASDKPILAAPAMNARMWEHPATRRNVAQLHADGVRFVSPGEGVLACGEEGAGRMAEPIEILEAVESFLTGATAATPPILPSHRLKGLRALITAGPTHEPLDPVRFLGNRSSGKQGIAIAEALAAHGADVTLVLGPTTEAPPPNVRTVRIETAEEMLRACEAALPADIAVCAAAVADWRVTEPAAQKQKKDTPTLTLALQQTPDILATLAASPRRPRLLIGFAAETEGLPERAVEKREKKGCDWLLANDVSDGAVFGAEKNEVYFVTEDGAEEWPTMRKREVAEKLATLIALSFSGSRSENRESRKPSSSQATRSRSPVLASGQPEDDETFHQTVLGEIERFLAIYGIAPTAFGRDAVKDPKFVFDLREGRSIRLDTLERVQQFMKSHHKKPTGAIS